MTKRFSALIKLLGVFDPAWDHYWRSLVQKYGYARVLYATRVPYAHAMGFGSVATAIEREYREVAFQAALRGENHAQYAAPIGKIEFPPFNKDELLAELDFIAEKDGLILGELLLLFEIDHWEIVLKATKERLLSSSLFGVGNFPAIKAACTAMIEAGTEKRLVEGVTLTLFASWLSAMSSDWEKWRNVFKG